MYIDSFFLGILSWLLLQNHQKTKAISMQADTISMNFSSRGESESLHS